MVGGGIWSRHQDQAGVRAETRLSRLPSLVPQTRGTNRGPSLSPLLPQALKDGRREQVSKEDGRIWRGTRPAGIHELILSDSEFMFPLRSDLQREPTAGDGTELPRALVLVW